MYSLKYLYLCERTSGAVEHGTWYKECLYLGLGRSVFFLYLFCLLCVWVYNSIINENDNICNKFEWENDDIKCFFFCGV